MDNTKVKVYQVVESILYRLKTGCQWRQLPMKQFFRVKYHWQSVYYHFQKWCKDGSWEQVWKYVLEKYKDLLDMSSVQT
ncbi:MAG: transposase [Bacteroidales bacterium]